jgi:hypothetical protein
MFDVPYFGNLRTRNTAKCLLQPEKMKLNIYYMEMKKKMKTTNNFQILN